MPEANNFFKLKLKIAVLFLFFLAPGGIIMSQEVYTHISDRNIYDFLDEMASMHLVSLNSAIKPYSRMFIAGELEKVQKQSDKLNKRQKKELEFYLEDYRLELQNSLSFMNPKTNLFRKNRLLATSLNPEGIFYKDSLFTMSFRFILGYQYFKNSNGTLTHRWNGAEAFGYIGKHWGMYVSLRDNRVDPSTDSFVRPEYLVQTTGKDHKNGGDFSEMRGGITYSWNWGSVGLVKDHPEWGNNYNGSNIFSGRTPSFAMLKLRIHPAGWLDFNYFHGWLVSEVEDSLRTFNFQSGKRVIYFEKYIAANMYTITPVKNLNISLGNSIVYSSYDVNPYFLIPFFFFKSLDHTLYQSSNAGQNAQVFFDISSRQIKNVHIYTSVFIDELSFKYFKDTANQSNWFGGKIGIHLNRLFSPNLSFTAELTATNPMTYKHYVPVTTFETGGYNLGHYLRDNAEEYYFALRYRPFRGFYAEVSFTDARKGPDYEDIRTPGHKVGGYPFMKQVIWENKTFAFRLNYEIINNGYISLGIVSSNITSSGYYNISTGQNITASQVMKKYTPTEYRGKTTTFTFGLNAGF